MAQFCTLVKIPVKPVRLRNVSRPWHQFIDITIGLDLSIAFLVFAFFVFVFAFPLWLARCFFPHNLKTISSQMIKLEGNFGKSLTTRISKQNFKYIVKC